MTHWNYRILAHETPDGVFYQIHEVYYSEEEPCSFSTATIGDEDLENLPDILDKMKKALGKPVLSVKDFPGGYTTTNGE